MKIKIRGGTAQTKTDLCKTCRNLRLVKGFNNTEFKDCNIIDFTKTSGWPFEVSECSSYEDVNLTSLYDMRQIAWHITPEVKQKAGFEHATTKIKVTKPGENEREHYNQKDGLEDYD